MAKKSAASSPAALKIISYDYTDGDSLRSSNTQLSVKSEAQPIAFGVGG